MRSMVWILAGALLVGCASHPKKPVDAAAAEQPKKKKHEKLIVTPERGLQGKVVRVNGAARFVVLNYPVGSLPGVGQQFGVYRQGVKVGQVRITGPAQDDNTVADIVSGDVQIGDETRGN